MTSERGTEATEGNRHDRSTPLSKRQPHPEGSEAAYERLTPYAFARQYVGGKAVADVVLGRQEQRGVAEAGSLLLARSAKSVEVLLGSGSREAEAGTSASSLAPNVVYREVELPELPYPEDHFDVVVAFGVLEELERPEEFLREAKRVLKDDGVLVLSASDKQADATYGRQRRGERRGERRGGLSGRRRVYVGELRELVGRHFGVVRLYRQGAVAGGFIFPDTEEGTSSQKGAALSEVPPSVEVARVSPDEPVLARLEAQPPTTRSVIAVCYDYAETLDHDERPYLLLDHDRRIFEERENLVEDVELMLGEIEQMQQSEVQAFLEALRIQRQQNLAQLRMYYLFYIRSYLRFRRNVAREDVLHLENMIRGNIRHHRNVIRANILHRRNVIFGRVHHLRNVVFEKILHRRNIIYGNIHALRKKGIKGSIRGALRRTAALYRRLAARRPD